MLKILEPNRKEASLGCRAAPLKNGSRIYEIPANGIDRAEPDQRHRLSIFYLACGTFFTHAMFLSAVAGEKTTPNFFPAKTAQMSVGRWCWRNHRLPSSTRINSSVCLSVRLSVHTCRLGIQWKMAQAQQIRSIILQNHESMT